ncbi:hypothetical protein H6P81_016983 [Aristolochia fimbriata]|uniref:Polygalacturonase n=1 Tax=Aristolochia fimbriata TaxID=158543 RepID=A0AAV7DYN1_ARIFI|nr:hypothetical protein H6P81_016983 [Aristolochia fimbriata]
MGSVEVFAVIVVLCIAPSVFGDFNVVDYGAVGDGHTDDTEAFKRAWAAACAAPGAISKLTVPRRTFLLNSHMFTGHCNATYIFFRLIGNLIAPPQDKFRGTGSWITFYKVNGLKFTGTGQMDGRGSTWWPQDCLSRPFETEFNCLQVPCFLYVPIIQPCGNALGRPTLLAFESCKFLTVRFVKLVNSARNHVTVNGCKWVDIHNIHIASPDYSPNTDGINIGSSWNVQVNHSFIESGIISTTGDDCISFLPGSSNINVTNITCGPGHGIRESMHKPNSCCSVGSMDKGEVEQVRVTNCVFKNTMFGARIKTKQGGTGQVKGIIFRDNWMQRVHNPIIIDQYYASAENKSSAVAISNVQFTGFHGMATGDLGIKLACSKTVPCTDIRLSDIHLVSATPHKQLSSYCLGVQGPHCPDCTPSVPCL